MTWKKNWNIKLYTYHSVHVTQNMRQCNSLANIYSEQYLVMKYCYLELTWWPSIPPI